MNIRNLLLTTVVISILASILWMQMGAEKALNDGSNQIVKKSLEERIEDRIAQEVEMTIDPELGYVPRKELIQARKETKKQWEKLVTKAAIPDVIWEERGPNDVGGRTRAIMFDPNDPTNKKVWSGGVGGGLWYSDNITTTNANWQKVDDFWSNMAIASMDHDPVNTDVFYVGTGEGYNNADAIDGDGIWKSTDGGSTWSQMSNTTSFNDCNQIKCFKQDHILVATGNGLRLSTNAGASWTTVLSGGWADAEEAANGDLYAGNFSGDVYKSTDDGATFTIVRNGGGSRVEIATSPSNSNYVYALINSSSDVTNILKSTNAGATWVDQTIPLYKEQGSCSGGSNVFTRGQGWYDLIAIVHPTDPERIIVGGVDLHRSEDGGASWESISYWTGACDAYLHADQHALISRPGFPDQIVSGNDGGVAYSATAFAAGSNPTWEIQNENYNITQFYGADLHPGADVNYIIAGAQDNGTKKLTSPGIGGSGYVSGGDGAYCHIDQNEPNNQISAYVYNNYYISSNGSSFPSYSIDNTGRFINPTEYDDVGNILYTCATSNTYYFIDGIGGTKSTNTRTIPAFGGTISCIKVSPNDNNNVYFGISGQRICKITNPTASNPTFTDLGNPSSGYISSIDVEKGNENHLLATYSNYGVTSVVESVDGGNSWISCEGDLPNIPVRWGIFNPNDPDQAIIATELGVWSTDNLNGGSTDWDPTNIGLANTRVDQLVYRDSDKTMLASTHGRGVFTTTSFNLDCLISNVQAGAQNCDSNTDTYTQELIMTLINTPGSGTISINGQSFSFPFNNSSTTQTYTLINLLADGQSVDLNIQYSANPSCSKVVTAAFDAPNAGCILDNYNCGFAMAIGGTGTYTTNGPADGNGCHNCASASHADWWKFTAPTDGVIDIATCLKEVDTRLWLYEGSCNSLVSLGGNDDACPMTPNGNAWASELLQVTVVANTTYYLEWDNRWSASGFDFDFTFTSTGGCSGTDHLYVDAGASGPGTGCDWNNAMPNLQDAINAAALDANINAIWVKAGTYYPGATGTVVTRDVSFNTTEGVSIYGGFDGSESTLEGRNISVNETILSGDIGVANVTLDNCYHVVKHNANFNLTIDGFTIQDGRADVLPNLAGAAVENSGNVTLENCLIKDHFSTNAGSAIVNSGSTADFKMSGVIFENNGPIPFVNANGALIVVTANTNNAVKE